MALLPLTRTLSLALLVKMHHNLSQPREPPTGSREELPLPTSSTLLLRPRLRGFLETVPARKLV